VDFVLAAKAQRHEEGFATDFTDCVDFGRAVVFMGREVFADLLNFGH
jgi:hypothetical protein